MRFLTLCAEGKMAPKLDPSSDAFALALEYQCYLQRLGADPDLRDYGQDCRCKELQDSEIAGKTVKLEVMDIERLRRHTSEGKPRDELVVDFSEVSGSALPCVFVPGGRGEYDYALTAIPGEALRFMYEKYGQRLLEANVRSCRSRGGKVNAGTRQR